MSEKLEIPTAVINYPRFPLLGTILGENRCVWTGPSRIEDRILMIR